ncbi:MAG: CCA tRNA nucleotidyltransferase [Candidatus Omnitrophica bacterium]|nr:CCA tRNA nucleotidyltransferase [Candidatus Omnitrophota bacterium]
MQQYLIKLPSETLSLIETCRTIAAKMKVRAYLVGGFVRDLIMGCPNLDLDITVEGDGIDFAQNVAEKLNAHVLVHRRFGTATISIGHHHKIDIASARKEIYPKPASLPEVSSGTLKDDLYRRDFTINTMAISINSDDFGRLIDLFGGQQDLKKNYIRILHPASFIDDPTRILRAIRFEQRYQFHLEPHTYRCLEEAVKKGMLEIVQPHRLRDELILILKEKQPPKYIHRIHRLCGLKFIHPHLKFTRHIQRLLFSAGESLEWFDKNFPKHRTIERWLVYLLCLVDSLTLEEATLLGKRFAFRSSETNKILSYLANRNQVLRRLSCVTIRPSTVYQLLQPLADEVILALLANRKDKNLLHHIELFFRHYNKVSLSIKGKDLHQMGFTPGPQYQHILRSVLHAKLDGIVKNHKEEREFVQRFKLKKKL